MTFATQSAHRVGSLRHTSSGAIGGTADILRADFRWTRRKATPDLHSNARSHARRSFSGTSWREQPRASNQKLNCVLTDGSAFRTTGVAQTTVARKELLSWWPLRPLTEPLY